MPSGFKPLRLREHDYSQAGFYFITICVKDGHWLLWEEPDVAANCVRPTQPIARPDPVAANCVRPILTPLGRIVESEVAVLSTTYPELSVDNYVVMPNHVHLLIGIRTNGEESVPTISRAIKQFKGSVTKQTGYSIWQKSFYDHIIRDESDYLIKWNYIENNPFRWNEDKYNKS